MDDLFKDFRILSHIKYPPFSLKPFEVFFYEYLKTHPEYLKLKEKFIPIFWTEIYIKSFNNYIIDTKLNTLPSNQKYFTVIQHCSGIKNTIPINTNIYSMGSNIGSNKLINSYIPLPLTYYNPELFNSLINTPKDIFLSFIGSNTHPVRRNMVNFLNKKPGVYMKLTKWSNNIPKSDQDTFLNITARSIFTLAPRGFGITSFRLYEALNMGSIPIYISDIFWLPFQEKIDWKKLAILCTPKEIPSLYFKLRNIPYTKIQEMKDYYKSVSHLFTYEGIANYIIEKELELTSI